MLAHMCHVHTDCEASSNHQRIWTSQEVRGSCVQSGRLSPSSMDLATSLSPQRPAWGGRGLIAQKAVDEADIYTRRSCAQTRTLGPLRDWGTGREFVLHQRRSKQRVAESRTTNSSCSKTVILAKHHLERDVHTWIRRLRSWTDSHRRDHQSPREYF